MEIKEIIEKLEELKSHIWAHVENEETETEKDIKEETNYLLDLLDTLAVERMIEEDK